MLAGTDEAGGAIADDAFARFSKYFLEDRSFRVVNRSDLVPRLRLAGYVHVGQERYRRQFEAAHAGLEDRATAAVSPLVLSKQLEDGFE